MRLIRPRLCYPSRRHLYDSSTPVWRRHLTGADAKGSYAARRLIGMCRQFPRPAPRGLLTAPGSPRYALARNLRKTPSSLSAFAMSRANHPVIHMPPAATSWASCLFAVDVNNDKSKLRIAQVINCVKCNCHGEKKPPDWRFLKGYID